MIDILNIDPHEVSADLKGYAIGIYGGPGLGKAQPNSTLLPTPDGVKSMGELRPGDRVFNRKGQPTKVLNVYPQGKKSVYELTFADGRSTLSCEEHLWTYVTSRGNLKTVPLKRMIKEGLVKTDGKHYRYHIPIPEALEYKEKILPVDPYVVGALLGDGSTTLSYLMLSSADEFIPNKIAEILKCQTEKTSKHNYNWVFFNGHHSNGTRKLINTFEALCEVPEVIGNSFEKTIPPLYFEGSVNQRASLLRGLLDTDGSISAKGGRVSYYSVNYELAQGVVDLARSLGFIASINAYDRTDKASVEFLVSIQGLEHKDQLFSLPRKVDIMAAYLGNGMKKNSRKTISLRKIEYSHDEESTCISVAGEEALYVTENYIVTHNTSVSLQAEKPLLIAAEKGYKTIPNTMAVDVNSWTDLLTVASQLKKPEAQEKYKTIVLDTLDDFVFAAEQYVLQINGVSKMSEINYGGGYQQMEQMFRKFFKDITRNYGLIVIAHADIKLDEDDPEKKLKYATLAVNKKAKKVVIGLLDLLIFVEGDRSQPGVTTMHFKSSPNWEAKSRFPNIVDSAQLSYSNLIQCINDAIGDIATVEHHKQYYPEQKHYSQEDFQKIKKEVEELANSKVAEHGVTLVVKLINNILGKKIADTDAGNTSALLVLIEELKNM